MIERRWGRYRIAEPGLIETKTVPEDCQGRHRREKWHPPRSLAVRRFSPRPPRPHVCTKGCPRRISRGQPPADPSRGRLVERWFRVSSINRSLHSPRILQKRPPPGLMNCELSPFRVGVLPGQRLNERFANATGPTLLASSRDGRHKQTESPSLDLHLHQNGTKSHQ